MAGRKRLFWQLGLEPGDSAGTARAHQALPHPGAIKSPIGRRLQDYAIKYRAHKIIPFSSFHQFEREASMWGNEFVPALPDYYVGEQPHKPEILPPFLRVDCERDDIHETQA